MGKNIVLCCDGTSNQFAGDQTNVVRLFRCASNIPGQQLTFYDPLSEFTVTHDVPIQRSHEEKPMGHAFRKLHRDRGGSHRGGDERGEQDEDGKTEN